MLVTARTNYSLGRDWPILPLWAAGVRNVTCPSRLWSPQVSFSLLIVLIAAANQGGVKFMVDFTAPVFWLFFLLTGIGLFVLRFRYPQLHGRSKCLFIRFCRSCSSGHARSCSIRSLLFTFENQAIRVAIYVMLSGVVVWLVARLKKFA